MITTKDDRLLQATIDMWGKRWRSWLRHCATSRKVAEFDSRWYLYDVSLTLRFRSHLTNEYQESFLGVKTVGAQGWQPCHIHMPIVWKSRKPQTSGALEAYLGLCRDSCTLLSICIDYHQWLECSCKVSREYYGGLWLVKLTDRGVRGFSGCYTYRHSTGIAQSV